MLLGRKPRRIYLSSACQLFRQLPWEIQSDPTYNFDLFCLEGFPLVFIVFLMVLYWFLLVFIGFLVVICFLLVSVGFLSMAFY